MQASKKPFKDYPARHFGWATSEDGRVATVTLNRPEKKNPLTFESYAELRDLFRDLGEASDVRAIVLTGAGDNFCSGGDVFEIIEPLTKMAMPDGICAGAGAILAMASDMRLATPEAKTAFLFTRVGLAGADMGACGILPRIIGQGRAAELLFTGRAMSAEEGKSWGFFNALHARADLLSQAGALARTLADGPFFAHGMTKTMLNQEWAMGLDEIIEAEAQAQAICMATQDFRRAFDAFAAKRRPEFQGD